MNFTGEYGGVSGEGTDLRKHRHDGTVCVQLKYQRSDYARC